MADAAGTLNIAYSRLLLECLGMSGGGSTDRLLVIFDQFGRDLAEGLADESELRLPGRCDCVYLPMSAQQRVTAIDEVPRLLTVAFGSASAVVTCLTDSDSYTRCRAYLLDAARATGLRIVHLPGVDPRSFVGGMRNSDFHGLHRSARVYQRALDAAADATVITTTSRGERRTLELSLEGRRSHICGGIAEPGEIMNIPTGEVYIAPIERLSNGTLVLNGSTDRIVFSERDEIELVFEAGVLDVERSHFSETYKAKEFMRSLTSERDRNATSMTLCELGVGLNEGIESLTGDEIFDEKMSGTMHVALGLNQPFGGALDGTYHRDLIFRPTALFLDGAKIDLPATRGRTTKPYGG